MQNSRTAMSLLSTLLFTFWIVPIHAEVPLKLYETTKDVKEMQTYLTGVGKGYFWANVHLIVRQLPPLYCPPEKLAVNARNYVEILDDYLSKPGMKSNLASDRNVEEILLYALQEVFPCK